MHLYLGEKMDFWMELRNKADELGVANLLRENAALRAKVSQYESKLDEIAQFRAYVDGIPK